MKILIIGSSGFIGSALLNKLLSNKDNQITACDISIPIDYHAKYETEINNNQLLLIKDDYTDENSFHKLDKDYDHFYMLSSVVGVNRCIENPHQVLRINTSLIMNSLNWLAKSNVKKVLFTSTSECYAGSVEIFNYNVPTSEEVPVCISDIKHPRFTYAATKILGESAFLNYAKVYGFESVIIRYQNIYGPNMGFKHVIPHLFERFYYNEDNFKIYGGSQTRAFCYISDAVDATIMAMNSEVSNGEIYHIGNQNEITIEYLVKLVGKMMNYNGDYSIASPYPGSVARRSPDISKANKDFGYIPKISIHDGLKKTMSWYLDYLKNNKIEQDGFKPPDELSINK